jgi:NAD(P)-dependent dehydrogenase (short-subunit alcohol dehydrogenase family)
MMKREKVCLITGVGPGTGAALVERFAAGGYEIAMLARSADRLAALERRVPNCHAFACDVSNAEVLLSVAADIKSRLGAPDVIVHNAVGGAFGDILTVEAGTLEQNFKTNVMALFHLAQFALPGMMEAGSGVILATGNTSAYRGRAQFAGFAPTKAAQRILLESIARKAGPAGVHAAYVAIDAVIDVPWTRKQFPEKPDAFFCKPVDIAEECYRIAHQPNSAWTFDSVIRPCGEAW